MLQRMWALTRKEFIQIRRDRRTLAMMIMLPLLWLVMFGYAFSFDVQELKVAVVDNSGTEIGRLVAGAFRSYDRFRLVDPAEMDEASIRAAMHRGEVQMGIIIPAGYGEGTEEHNPQLQVLVDGSDLFGAQTGARLIGLALEPIQDEIRTRIEAQVQAEARQRIEQEMGQRVAEARAKAEAAIADKTREMQAELKQRIKAQIQAQLEAQIQQQIKAQLEQRKAALLQQAPPAMHPQLEQQFARLEQQLATASPPIPMPELELNLPIPEFKLPDDLIQLPSIDDLDLKPPAPPQMIPQVEILYNPGLKSANVMIPGLLGLVTMFMATLMTALGIVREREYGTLEQLVVTPIKPLELMLGKLLPYALVAAVDFGLVFVAGVYLFHLTFAGNLPVFLGITLLFLLTTLSLGLLLSTLAQNQQQAMQLAMFIIFPQILLSGLIFPLSSLPRVIQYIAYLLPFTYFVPIARGMFIKGQELALLTTPVLVLAGYAAAMVTLASLRFRKRLG